MFGPSGPGSVRRPPTMSSATATRDCPVMDDDPFGHDILEDPHEFHRRLRDAGPLVYLSRYDVYAMGRFDQVRRSLNDWQSFQSSAGVGLANFRYEPPWRPPSLLLEADPPAHDAVRSAFGGWGDRHRAGVSAAGLLRRRGLPRGGAGEPAALQQSPVQHIRSPKRSGGKRPGVHRRTVPVGQRPVST